MDAREQRGLAIAERARIVKGSQGWYVPSSDGKGKYKVVVDSDEPSCTCPDHENRRAKCKHIFAVEHVIEREQHADGSETVSETMTVTQTVQRKTYPQQWPAYNAAQTTEKERFRFLLRDLCAAYDGPIEKRRGRPRLPMPDALFSVCYKVYSTISTRRFMSDMRDAHERGFVSKVPHHNTIISLMDNEGIEPMLREMIQRSSLPLKYVETDFAVDSTGFSVARFIRWIDHKYGTERKEHDWVKVHAMCGVKTNVVTAVEIRGRNANDSPLLPPLLETTAEGFDVREVSADKGYIGRDNVDIIAQAGATPYIALKKKSRPDGNDAWNRMFHHFALKRDDFLANYHKRSNIESTFSAIKRKFGSHLRSRTDVAMKNEALAKFVCHNIVCCIHESIELGINVGFLPK